MDGRGERGLARRLGNVRCCHAPSLARTGVCCRGWRAVARDLLVVVRSRPGAYLTKSVLRVVFQQSIPTETRHLILCISNSERLVDKSVGLVDNMAAKRL